VSVKFRPLSNEPPLLKQCARPPEAEALRG